MLLAKWIHHKPTKKKKYKLKDQTFSLGRSTLVVCNLSRRFSVSSSSAITSAHHSLHLSSLFWRYLASGSESDISPSSFTSASSDSRLWFSTLFNLELLRDDSNFKLSFSRPFEALDEFMVSALAAFREPPFALSLLLLVVVFANSWKCLLHD